VTRVFSASKRGQRSWCGRRDLNPHGPCCPTDFRTLLRLSPPLLTSAGFGVWTILSPCPGYPFRFSGAARLVSTPSPAGKRSGQGLARDRHVAGSPEFEQFCIAGFPASTQVSRLSPIRLPIPPRPRGWLIHGALTSAAKNVPTVDFTLLLPEAARSSWPSCASDQ
jgi:hypothetical protein